MLCNKFLEIFGFVTEKRTVTNYFYLFSDSDTEAWNMLKISYISFSVVTTASCQIKEKNLRKWQLKARSSFLSLSPFCLDSLELAKPLCSRPFWNKKTAKVNTQNKSLRYFISLRFYVKLIYFQSCRNFESEKNSVKLTCIISIFISFKFTVWKFQHFSITQILREINFR